VVEKIGTTGMGSTALQEHELPSVAQIEDSERTILIVDDEEPVVNALSEFLSMRGYAVHVAMSSRQALSMIYERSFSTTISDLRLPGMNGVELLEHVLDVDPEMVFIIMTGYASVQSAVDALKRGAYDYIVKPFSMHELEKTVKLGLERRRLAKENLELSQLMRKLVEIDQVKSNIISTVSHEFRTPLMSLKGYLAMLAQDTNGSNGVSDNEGLWLKAMKDNVGRLEVLILNLLLMTEADAGELLIASENVDMNRVIGECVSCLDRLSKSKEVKIRLAQKDDGRVTGDVEKLAVAMTNLIENAIKFNLDRGVVDINVSSTYNPDGVRVAILDTGIGIDGEKLKSILNSFTQADMTHNRRFAGAGLGLPVAKAIVEAHGGSIDVESRPGTGSTFYVWLPRRNGG
jgi:two-component system sensor histidine kinase/response regulator